MQSGTKAGAGRRRFVTAASAAVALGSVAGSVRAQGKPKVVLRAVGAFDKGSVFNKAYFELMSRIEKKSGGELAIEWRGGPEAVGSFQSVNAVGKGVFDMVVSVASYYAQGMPEAVAIHTEQPNVTLKALHESGAIKVLDEIHREKLNCTLLGLPLTGVGYVFVTKQPPQNLEFFKGKKIRSIPIYTPLLRALGAATVTLPPYEVYPALERGVVDGLGWSGIAIEEFRFQEVAKYMMMPLFYNVRLVLLMNQNAFDKLGPPLQKVLLETVREVDDWGRQFAIEEMRQEHERLQKAGMQRVSLADAEAKKFLEIASDSLWAEIIKSSPKNGARLKEVFLKANTLA